MVLGVGFFGGWAKTPGQVTVHTPVTVIPPLPNRPSGVVLTPDPIVRPPGQGLRPVVLPDPPIRPRQNAPGGQVAPVVDPFRPPAPPAPEPPKVPVYNSGLSVKWVAPFLDGSGYAEAARNYVAALTMVGVDVVAQNHSFENVRTDYGRAGKFAKDALARRVPCKVNVVFLPPEHFPTFWEPKAYNIGLFDWEMEKLPDEWVRTCNGMDEIWVPCRWTAEAARNSGVMRPIHVFGHCATPEDYADGPVTSFPEMDPSWYKFYSVFQWTERKNPKGLLRAYLKEFTLEDPVVLILKTYGADYSAVEQGKVMAEIEEVKKEVGGEHQPRILAILGMMSKDELQALHRLGDCFVLIHRAEGWGLPHFEACMMGKPVITTKYSANLEFTREENSFLVDYGMTPVSGMPWFKWYQGGMEWAEPDVDGCRRHMRHVFRHRQEARKKGHLAQSYVLKNFTWEAIGTKMRERLTQIMGSL